MAGALAVVLWGAGPAAHGQATGYPGLKPNVEMSGRMLDRNPQLGAGGYNYTRPLSPLMMGNTYASGLAGGGFSLQSFSPIGDPTAFRAALGSAALATFRRDSVSVAGSPLGNAPLGQPFYDPSLTVPTVGFLRGFSAPPTDATASGGPSDLRLQMRLNLQTALRSQIVGLAPTGPAAPTPPITRESTLATSSSIFGPEPPPRLLLPTEPQLPWGRTTPGEAEERGAAGWENALMERRLAKPTAAPLDLVLRRELYPRVGTPAPGEESATRAGRLGQILPEPEAAPAERGPLAPPRITDPSVLPGFDVFTDMQLAVALLSDPQAAWFSEMQRALRERPELARRVDAQAAQDAARFLQQMLDSPLRSLTGAGSSALNDQMLKAESLMELGRYAEAADRYDAARLAAPSNPLPLLGKGHALLGSGQYWSAAVALLHGLELAEQAPGVASLLLKRLDLSALMGGGEIIDIRRADIMKQLERRETPELRFLLGYLEYHSGDREHGLEDLKRAAENPRRSPLIGRYPALLRGEGPPLPVEPPVERSEQPPHQ